MDSTKVILGLLVGIVAIFVAWVANTSFPTAVTALNAAVAEAEIVLGFLGITIGATTIGGTALETANRNTGLSMDQVRAPAVVGLLGALLLLSATRVAV
jgi:hypothetical protein